MSSNSTHFSTRSNTSSGIDPIDWHCHCCTAKNRSDLTKCRVCGRPESYAQEGYHLPFHGENAKLYRPSHILTVLDSIHEVDSEGWSSLHSACANGNTDIVRELLKLKSKVEALTNKRQTPLHLAVYSGSFACVEQLLKHKAELNVFTLEERNTPLHMACESGFARIAQLLIQHGANIHALNVLERTPLHSVAISGRTDLALLLLRAGAKHNVLDIHGWTPCQIAELFGHKPFQELMVRQTMTEKQAVFKDLPPAPWHSELWNNVVTMQTLRRDEYHRELEQKHADEEAVLKIKQDKLHAVLQAKRDVRQLELQQYRENKASTILQEARKQQQALITRGSSTGSHMNERIQG